MFRWLYEFLVIGPNPFIFVKLNNDANLSTQMESQQLICQTQITKNDSNQS